MTRWIYVNIIGIILLSLLSIYSCDNSTSLTNNNIIDLAVNSGSGSTTTTITVTPIRTATPISSSGISYVTPTPFTSTTSPNVL